MTDSSSVSIDEVRALVAERHRFDEWLTALDSRRADTPSHVYERVHGDYVARRDQVMAQLHNHVPGLEALLADLDARATDMALRSRAEEDERAEAMLRHAVGEYDNDKWDEVRNRVESALETIGGERQALDEQRDDVRGLLESARPAAAAIEEVEVELAAPEAAESMIELAEEPQGREAETSPGGTPDWLGAMTPADVPVLPADEHSSTGASAADPFGGMSDPELTDPNKTAEHERIVERPHVWGQRGSGTSAAAHDADHQEHDSVDVFGDASSSAPNKVARGADAAPESTPEAAPNAFDELAFLRSVIDPQTQNPQVPRSAGSGEAQKTLRCTECGTMNLPTEWYCERCGGELAAF